MDMAQTPSSIWLQHPLQAQSQDHWLPGQTLLSFKQRKSKLKIGEVAAMDETDRTVTPI